MHPSGSFGRFSQTPSDGDMSSMYASTARTRPGRPKKIVGKAAPRLFHLKFAFQVVQIDAERDRLVMDIELPFCMAVGGELNCAPLDADDCRVDYHCGFDFTKGWRGTLTRVLGRREMNTDLVDSLSRLKQPSCAL
jgi:hypothetical protein